jgi:hypothetical protein
MEDLFIHGRRTVRLRAGGTHGSKAICPDCGYGPLESSCGVEAGETRRILGKAIKDMLPPPKPEPVPQDGSVGICGNCGGFHVWYRHERSGVLTVRRMALLEMEEYRLAHPDTWQVALRISASMIRRRFPRGIVVIRTRFGRD